MKKLLALSLVFFTACATTKQANKLRFETNWVRSVLKTENYGFKHFERMAPLVDGAVVFQGNGLDGVVALTADNGRLKWRFNVRNGVESGFAMDERNLFFGASDGNFYAVNKLTGKIQWSFPTRVENLGPALYQGGVVYFIAGNNVLYSLDAKTGKQLWNYNRGDVSSLSIRGAARPTVYKNTVYAGFSDGYLVALNINDGALNWERKLSTNIKFVDVDATAVVDENNIWISSYDGALYCLSRVEGQVQWRVDDGGYVAVTLDNDKLYYPSISGNIYSLNKSTGTEFWKYKYEESEGVPTQILLADGLLIFGTSNGSLIALTQNQGKKASQFMPGAGIAATPVLSVNKKDVFVYSNQANLYKLRLDWYNPQKDYLLWKN